MTRHAVLLALALCAMAGAAGTTPFDASLPPELQGAAANPKYFPPPPTDDSMWVITDSVYVGASPDGWWRGLNLDPNGQHFWICSGSGVYQKRDRLTGTVVYTFNGATSPYSLVRFDDSIAVASYSSNTIYIYDTLGVLGRTITGFTGLRGIDWDGSKFWVTSTASPQIRIYSRGGTLLRSLTWTTGLSWAGVICLDRAFPNRLWFSRGQTTLPNIYYCSFDTSANTFTALQGFNHPCYNSYPNGLGWEGPNPQGSRMLTVGASAGSNTYVKWAHVHDPLGPVIDAGVSHLLAPSSTVDSGAVITPACSTRNFGTSAASYWVKMRIEPSYLESAYVTAQAAGSASYVTFADWTAAQRGTFGVSCSTELTGDATPANDKQTGLVDVQVIDAGVTQTLAPTGTVPLGTVVTPACSVYNYGTTTPISYNVRMVIGAGYSNVMPVAGHVPGTWVYVTFPDWTADEVGTFAITNCTELPGDMNPGNDCDNDTVVVEDTAVAPPITGWHEIGQVPMAPSGKLVKDGGWMVYDASRELYYVAKGYKAGDFYSFEPVSRTWTQLADWPLGAEAKPPYKGSVGVSDGNGVIYATKGNNTPGYWKYTADDSLGTWTQLTDVPLGLSNKKVKGGTDMAYIEQDSAGSVYLLKGYKTEFYRYDVAAGTWQTLAEAPIGVKAKYDKGSWLAFDEPNRKIYAHKAKYMELYAYDLDSMAWGTMMPGMPLANGQTGKSKKAKDGSDAVVINGKVYTLKGGNTLDFYTYDFATATWAEKETIPSFGSTAKKKRVKAGGSMATDGVYAVALKGNKTAELWLYGDPTPFATAPRNSGVMASKTLAGSGFVLGPNPLASGHASLRFVLPVAGPAQVAVFDVMGRAVVSQSLALGRAGSIDLDLRSLSAGVYLVKLTSGSYAGSQKLVVQR
ncbi:MAG: T9SS type A sorting domain-containing protein [bacterium]